MLAERQTLVQLRGGLGAILDHQTATTASLQVACTTAHVPRKVHDVAVVGPCITGVDAILKRDVVDDSVAESGLVRTAAHATNAPLTASWAGVDVIVGPGATQISSLLERVCQ